MVQAAPPPQLLLSALFEEYRALYSLAELRMNALDRRVPVAGGTLAAVVGGIMALPPATQFVLLLGVPAALIWFMRSTVNHVRSLEDVLRRIEEIEREANRLLGKTVLSFQSRHPSARRDIGGRTGRESTGSVLATITVLLVACAFQFRESQPAIHLPLTAYACYLGVVWIVVLWERVRLQRYTYAPRADLRSAEH